MKRLRLPPSAIPIQSGEDAARDVEEKLRRYAPDTEIHFKRIAVLDEQIER